MADATVANGGGSAAAAVVASSGSGGDGEIKITEEAAVDDEGGNTGERMNVDEPQQSAAGLKNEGDDEDEDATLSQLIAENERLQGVFQKLNSRQTVLEEFIEVEYGERFDSFIKKREHLINVMGLGQAEDTDKIDGTRSAKSTELANLLKISQTANSQGTPGGSNQSQPQGARQHNAPYNQHQRNKNWNIRGKRK